MPNEILIEKILSREEFIINPPILLDIGASGKMYSGWEKIAKYSICIAFDADLREIKYIEDGSTGYKKIYLYNKIVADTNAKELDFYLTDSPFCSSLLEPDTEKLKDWSIADLFHVEKKIKLKTTNLLTVINGLGIKKIDWFKTDSQGTDLRLFKSLNRDLIDKILVADFEPGIIKSYKGEDKLSALMEYMDTVPFWMNDLVIPKTQRINKQIKEEILYKNIPSKGKNMLNLIIKSAPMCGEVSYFNDFKNTELFSQRDFLLMWVISYIKGHLGFSLEIADVGEKKFKDPVFSELKSETLRKINKNIKKIKFKKILLKLLR